MNRQRDLNFPPGTEYLCCNVAHIRAAVIVERACGQSFGAFSTEHIFRSPRRERDFPKRPDVRRHDLSPAFPRARRVLCAARQRRRFQLGASRGRVDAKAARFACAACTEAKRHHCGAARCAGRTVSPTANRRPAGAHGPRGKTTRRRKRAGAERTATLNEFRGGTTFSFSSETPLRLQATSRNATIDYRAVAIAKPSAADLAAYAGSYCSAAVEVVHALSVQAGRLSAGRWPGPALAPEPTFAGGFMFGRGWPATFTRAAAGGINGTNSPTAAGGA